MPAFSASDRRPALALRTTTNGSPDRVTCNERTAPMVATSDSTLVATSTRSKLARNTSKVESFDPSSTTTTSNIGYSRFRAAWVASRIPASSL